MSLALVEFCKDPALLNAGYKYTVVVVAEGDETDVLDLVDFKSAKEAVEYASYINGEPR